MGASCVQNKVEINDWKATVDHWGEQLKVLDRLAKMAIGMGTQKTPQVFIRTLVRAWQVWRRGRGRAAVDVGRQSHSRSGVAK